MKLNGKVLHYQDIEVDPKDIVTSTINFLFKENSFHPEWRIDEDKNLWKWVDYPNGGLNKYVLRKASNDEIRLFEVIEFLRNSIK